MTRLVTHEDDSPLRIDAEDVDEKYGDVAICRCGLAESYPFCDGSHRVTESEDDGVLYRYTNDSSAESSGSDVDTDAGAETNDDDADTDDADTAARSRRVVERIVDTEG